MGEHLPSQSLRPRALDTPKSMAGIHVLTQAHRSWGSQAPMSHLPSAKRPKEQAGVNPHLHKTGV